MVVFSIIQKSQLEGAARLDAEYFMPEYLGVATHLGKLQSSSLDSFCSVTASAFYPSATEFYGDGGLPFLRVVDIVDHPVIDESQHFEYLPEEFVGNCSGIKTLSKGDIVISKVGTPCYAGLLNGNLKRVALSRTVLGIERIHGINPLYLLAFLRSKYGFFQLMREREQQIQLQLTLDRVRRVRVFVPSEKAQEEVAGAISDYYKTAKHSECLYLQAEALLLEELGLTEEEFEDKLAYIVDYSDVEESDRVDADYFQPKYEKLISKLKAQNSKPLLDAVDPVPARFDPAKTPDKEFKYIELADIDSSIGIISGFSDVLGKDAPGRARRVLKTNDVVVSSVAGSIERAAIVGEEYEGALASTGFFQFRSQEILPEVILLLAKSPVLRLQLERETTGTILPAVSSGTLKNVVVPILPQPTQEKIADLVRESHRARQESKRLLEEAKRKVEELIEKGDG